MYCNEYEKKENLPNCSKGYIEPKFHTNVMPTWVVNLASTSR